MISDDAVACRFRDYFDELFQGAYSGVVDRLWLASYERVWLESKDLIKREDRFQTRVRKLQPASEPGKKAPRKIAGKVWCFTGRIPEWPRPTRLYPKVRRLGGSVVELSGIKKADCLVHGSSLGAKNATRKLRAARLNGVPTMREEQFLKLLNGSKRFAAKEKRPT